MAKRMGKYGSAIKSGYVGVGDRPICCVRNLRLEVEAIVRIGRVLVIVGGRHVCRGILDGELVNYARGILLICKSLVRILLGGGRCSNGSNLLGALVEAGDGRGCSEILGSGAADTSCNV